MVSRILRSPLSQLFAVALTSFSFGCAPQIGDECETSVDCSQGGERLCDITQPGGYCTVFNCEPDSCPENSVCLAFAAQPSSHHECAIGDGVSRFARSFCMASCGSDGDCRSGYDCIDVGVADNPWAAVLIDADESGKVCIAPQTSEPVPETRAAEVCTGTSPSVPLPGEAQGGADGG
jgi:hypothetical protein